MPCGARSWGSRSLPLLLAPSPHCLEGALSKQARISVPWHGLHPRPRRRHPWSHGETSPLGRDRERKTVLQTRCHFLSTNNHPVWVVGPLAFTDVHRDAEVTEPVSSASSPPVFWINQLRLQPWTDLARGALPRPRMRRLSSREQLPAGRDRQRHCHPAWAPPRRGGSALLRS